MANDKYRCLGPPSENHNETALMYSHNITLIYKSQRCHDEQELKY